MPKHRMAYELTKTFVYCFPLKDNSLLEVMGYILKDLTGNNRYYWSCSHHFLGKDGKRKDDYREGYETEAEALRRLSTYIKEFDPTSAVENKNIFN
ncbi:hypothetical protein LJC19_05045 [Oxalobacter sp. OttesenSCG-928-P03]|nr:hypothetical protein [Oxalobacter sp. OttesenSCG-928-P03]